METGYLVSHKHLKPDKKNQNKIRILYKDSSWHPFPVWGEKRKQTMKAPFSTASFNGLALSVKEEGADFCSGWGGAGAIPLLEFDRSAFPVTSTNAK